MSFKKLYEALAESGELQDFCRNMTGVWEKDKKSFIKQQTELENIANNLHVNLDLDDEFEQYSTEL
jgi:hypothetical protein